MTAEISFDVRGLYIGGRWVDAVDGGSFPSINPSTGEKLADVPLAGETDVDRAVAAARDAFPGWSRTPARERAGALNTLAGRIREHADELALLDAYDSGNSVKGMRGDMHWTADTLDYFAGLITEIKGETFAPGPRHLNLTRRQPYGVVGKINPFNHPFRFCAEKAAAPLAAGNTVVIKGSEQAPISSLKLGELCDGIFPPGVINVVTGGTLFVVAVAGKVIAGYAPFWFSCRKAVIGWALVPRGAVGLVFAQYALAGAILDERLFTAVTLMIILTTLVAPPVVRWLLPPASGPSQGRPSAVGELVSEP